MDEDNTLRIAVQNRIPTFAQILKQFESSLGCYVRSTATLTFFPSAVLSSEYFQDTHIT